MNRLFFKSSTVGDHYVSLKNERQLYISNLIHAINTGVLMSTTTKASILAAAMGLNEHRLSYYLMTRGDYILPDILKCCEILDSNRQLTQLFKKQARLVAEGARQSKRAKLLDRINALQMNKTTGLPLSLTSSRISKLRRWWMKSIPNDKLVYYALTYSMDGWKSLADYLHPRASDFQNDWFLNYVFTGEIPENSILAQVNGVTPETFNQFLESFRPDYSFIRQSERLRDMMTEQSKKIIAQYVTSYQLLWYWEELRTADGEVDHLLLAHLKEHVPEMSYGKLVERLLTLKNNNCLPELVGLLSELAESRLHDFKLRLNQPVLVMGDASGSMQVGINTATIISSLLTALVEAKLHFFKTTDVPVARPPFDVAGVIHLTNNTTASGGTAPAATLLPYLNQKKVVKTIVVVSDEEENIPAGHPGSGYWSWIDNEADWFADVYKRYREQVYPAQLVFISFKDTDEDGQMVASIKTKNPGVEPLQFRIHRDRPDLNKLDNIFSALMARENHTVKLINPEEVLPEIPVHKPRTELDDVPEIVISI